MGISMTRLAQALEMRRPTLLYHFANAGEVAMAALEDLLIAQTTFVLTKIALHTHPLDRLFARLTAIQAFHSGHDPDGTDGDPTDVGRVVFLTQAVATLGDAKVRQMIAIANQVFEVHRAAQKRAIEAAIHDGLVAPCDVDALTNLIRTVNDGMLIQRVVNDIPAQPLLDFIWTHVLEPLRLDTPLAARA
jgi:AcrR family transcriptional regulator